MHQFSRKSEMVGCYFAPTTCWIVMEWPVSRNSQPVVAKKSPANVKPMGIRDIWILARVLATCSRKYRLTAGSTLKGWHLQVRQFWEKRPLVVAVSHLHLHLPLNNSNILEKKTDNPFNPFPNGLLMYPVNWRCWRSRSRNRSLNRSLNRNRNRSRNQSRNRSRSRSWKGEQHRQRYRQWRR